MSVRELRLRPGEVWAQLGSEDVVLTSNGKTIALLTGIREDDLWDALDALRRARALVALDRIHRHSARQGTERLTDEEIEAEIRAARGHPAAAYPLPLVLPDPDDAVFLEAALASGADAVITGNSNDYPPERCHGMRVMTPARFIQWWGEAAQG